MSGVSERRVPFKRLLLGLLAFYLSLLLLLGVSSAMLRGSILPEGEMKAAVIVSLFISSILASLISAGRNADKRLLRTIIPAMGFIILVLAVHLMIPTGKTGGAYFLLAVCSVLLPAMLIGLIRPRKKRKR